MISLNWIKKSLIYNKHDMLWYYHGVASEVAKCTSVILYFYIYVSGIIQDYSFNYEFKEII